MRWLAILLLLPGLAWAAPGGGEWKNSPVPGEGAPVTSIALGAWYTFSGAVNTKSTSMSGTCVLWMNERHDATGTSLVEASVWLDSGDGVNGHFMGNIVEGEGGVRVTRGRYWISVDAAPIAAWARISVRCVEG